MKTIADLKALIPTLCDLLYEQDHEIGDTYYEEDECGMSMFTDYETNFFTYEEDGWYIDVTYRCSGESYYYPETYWEPSESGWKSASGEVTELIVSHYDEETEEETTFSEDELKELWKALDEVLEDIT